MMETVYGNSHFLQTCGQKSISVDFACMLRILKMMLVLANPFLLLILYIRLRF